jgi:hypothetical protein
MKPNIYIAGALEGRNRLSVGRLLIHFDASRLPIFSVAVCTPPPPRLVLRLLHAASTAPPPPSVPRPPRPGPGPDRCPQPRVSAWETTDPRLLLWCAPMSFMWARPPPLPRRLLYASSSASSTPPPPRLLCTLTLAGALNLGFQCGETVGQRLLLWCAPVLFVHAPPPPPSPVPSISDRYAQPLFSSNLFKLWHYGHINLNV